MVSILSSEITQKHRQTEFIEPSKHEKMFVSKDNINKPTN